MKTNYFAELIANFKEDEIENYIYNFLNTKPSKYEVVKLLNACREAMTIVGRKFEKREYFIGDVIYAGELQRVVLDALQPLMNNEKLDSSTIGLEDFYVDSRNLGEDVFKKILKSSGYDIVS